LILDEIKKKIQGIIGRELLFFETVNSTNTKALELAEKAPEGTVVLADSQNRGRGRLGRTWISPSGVNIYMSIILKPQIRAKDSTLITIMSAVACATALKNLTGMRITTKWPNDLMINNKKVGGILTELKSQKQTITSAIVGIGINVNTDVREFPEEVKQRATSLQNEAGVSYQREPIVAELLNEMDRWYNTLIKLKKETILRAWENLTSTIGREVMIVTPHETLTGTAESLDNEGMLILRLPSGESKRINSGDLTILRLTDDNSDRYR
jgi:BirA family biotin operon repressor/biotin-[acetyl-CoA-carboxylase] ligase